MKSDQPPSMARNFDQKARTLKMMITGLFVASFLSAVGVYAWMHSSVVISPDRSLHFKWSAPWK